MKLNEILIGDARQLRITCAWRQRYGNRRLFYKTLRPLLAQNDGEALYLASVGPKKRMSDAAHEAYHLQMINHSAAAGYGPAISYLADLSLFEENDPEKACRLFHAAAAAGDAYAYKILGYYSKHGRLGLTQDKLKAHAYYAKARQLYQEERKWKNIQRR